MTRCTKCKKAEAASGYRQCASCRARGRAYAAKYRSQNREAYNTYKREYMRAYGAAVRALQKDIQA